jgi:hypothetical protein
MPNRQTPVIDGENEETKAKMAPTMALSFGAERRKLRRLVGVFLVFFKCLKKDENSC